MLRVGLILLCSSTAIGCGGSSRPTGQSGTTAATLVTSSTPPSSTAGPTSPPSADSVTPSQGTSTSSGPSPWETGPGVVFDLGALPDAGSGTALGPAIPKTCQQAENGASTVGCMFYAVDMDSLVDTQQFAVVAANVQEGDPASVTIQTREGGVWTTFDGPVVINPLELHQFDLPDRHQEQSGLRVAGAYRVVSDVPIVTYQFQPVDGATSFLSDASMLYPVPTLDSINHIVNQSFNSSSSGGGYPYLTIVATVDGTNVDFTATEATLGGGVIPAAAAGQTVGFSMNDGDVATIVAGNSLVLTGARVITDDAHPVAVFAGHSCADIPANICCCDHLEEQLSGVRRWGQSFVGVHMPYRNPANPEDTFWQVYASEADTTVTFDAAASVTGVPAQLMLDAGDLSEFFVSAPAGVEADFSVSANKPIALVGYMTGAQSFVGTDVGDPAMVQTVSVEQFLHRYVVLVPGTWVNDMLMLTRPAGAVITVDGVAVPDGEFTAVGDGTYEVARVSVSDGVHVLDGDTARFGVVVVGWDEFDSYAYVGGTGTGIINPNPAM